MDEVKFFVALLVWLCLLAAWSEWMGNESKAKKNTREASADRPDADAEEVPEGSAGDSAGGGERDRGVR